MFQLLFIYLFVLKVRDLISQRIVVFTAALSPDQWHILSVSIIVKVRTNIFTQKIKVIINIIINKCISLKLMGDNSTVSDNP